MPQTAIPRDTALSNSSVFKNAISSLAAFMGNCLSKFDSELLNCFQNETDPVSQVLTGHSPLSSFISITHHPRGRSRNTPHSSPPPAISHSFRCCSKPRRGSREEAVLKVVHHLTALCLTSTQSTTRYRQPERQFALAQIGMRLGGNKVLGFFLRFSAPKRAKQKSQTQDQHDDRYKGAETRLLRE